MVHTRSDNLGEWLTLHLIPGLGNILFKGLLERFGNPGEVLEADVKELLKVEGLREGVARRIKDRACVLPPGKALAAVERTGARVVTFSDPEYPSPLKEIYDPPMLLYMKGGAMPSGKTFVGVVGSRNPTPYGLRVAEEVSQGLARRGIGIASGMARGIDSAAHTGCLGGRGFTAAVMGTGIDRIYPASNRKLYEKIAEKGVVISEFPPGTPPEPKNFPIRNRIISGMCKGVVVVEATKKSGSLITASLALDQGRDVFAVPGSIHSFKSTGCHHLIKNGAALVENSDDVLDGIGLNYAFAFKGDTFTEDRESAVSGMDSLELEIFEMIGDYPIHIDQIFRRSRLDTSEISGLLTKMELKGIVRQLPGKMFVRLSRIMDKNEFTDC